MFLSNGKLLYPGMEYLRLGESLVSPLQQYMYRITLQSVLLSIKTNNRFVTHSSVHNSCEHYTVTFTALEKLDAVC
jgi:hypothetical protein